MASESSHTNSPGHISMTSFHDASLPPFQGLDTQSEALAHSEALLGRDHASHHTSSESAAKELHRKREDSRHHEPSWLRDWWLWELAGIISSLIVTMAIIVMLLKYDGRPLPSWPYSITLNAMVSVLSTLAKVCPQRSSKPTWLAE